MTIDPRKGSGELAPLFDTAYVPHVVKQLAFGDFAFEGNTPKGRGLIGIERKGIMDLLQCIATNRLVGHQLPGMLKLYEFSYLLVEGITRPDPVTGELQVGYENKDGRTYWRRTQFGRRVFTWRSMDNYLTTLEHSGLKVRRVDNDRMTVQTVASLYHWYRDKAWHEHGALRGLYSDPYAVMTLEDKGSLVRRIAKEFSGIGVDRSLAVHEKFPTVWEMITAPTEDWLTIPGIGDGIADSVAKEIHERQRP